MKSIFFILSCVLFILSFSDCKKNNQEPAEGPQTPATPSQTTTPSPTVDPYTFNDETQSAKDLHQVLVAITDVNLIAGCVLDDGPPSEPYFAVVAGSSGTITMIRDVSAKYVSVSFNNALYEDGKTRVGVIIFKYNYHALTNPKANQNASFFRDYGFACQVVLSEYIVDGWKIEAFDPNKPINIVNTLPSDIYDPLTTDISWELTGKFRLTRISDNKEIIWDGKLTETLGNTENPQVFNPDKKQSIEWNKALVLFKGAGNGNRFGETYSMNIGDSIQMTKNFTCNFTPSGTSATRFHPFVSGITSYSLASYHPRTINYGPTSGCDNLTTVSFKDKKYTISLN